MRRRPRAKAAGSIGKWLHGAPHRDIVLQLTTPSVWTSMLLALVAIAAGYISLVSARGMIGFLGAGLAIVMLTIAVIDWRSFTIPDWLNAVGLSLALVHAAAQQPEA